MRRLLPLLLWAAGLPFVADARAASFDCDRAATAVEKMICAQSDLSKADEELARSFASALATTLRPATLRLDQSGWLAERDKLTTADDLRAAYRDRAVELSRLAEAWRRFRHAVPLEEARTRCLTPPEAPPDACTVAAFAAVAGGQGLHYQEQVYRDGEFRLGAGVVVFREKNNRLTPVATAAADVAHYAAPSLFSSPAGQLLLIPGYLEGTGNFNAGILYRREGETFLEIDTQSWLADLERRLPRGWGAWKGIYPDYETFTAWSRLWQAGDGNCCPTAGRADLTLGLRHGRLVIRELEIVRGVQAADDAR
jgi:uncharacterized protein YecT (DUF1311 family)